MKKKLMYEVPDAELIELKLEQRVIMASGDEYTLGGGGSYGESETNNNDNY